MKLTKSSPLTDREIDWLEEALLKYGSDKPDLRNPIEMQDVSEHFRGSGFKVFARLLEDPKNEVWAIPGPTGGSRAFCDRMNSWAQGEGRDFARHVRTLQDKRGGKLMVGSVFTTSSEKPMGLRVMETNATLRECKDRGIPVA